MEGCIHSDCGCSAYDDSKRSKGVLQLRLCCQTCGHLASEHRQLTDVDRYVSGELKCASNRHCDYHIPIADVPKSPVFGPYDPIILPWNDTTPEQESGVSCTCPGFQVSNVVRLQQKFHSQSVSEVETSLLKVSCLFCRHSLEHHCLKGQPQNQWSKGLDQIADGAKRLKLQGAAKVDLFTENGLGCVNMLTPADSTCGYFILLGLQRSMSGQIELVTQCTSSIDTPTRGQVGCPVPEEKERGQVGCPVPEEKERGQVVCPVPEEKECTESIPTDCNSRKVKRKRLTSTSGLRRSARLETKKQSVGVITRDVLIPNQLLVRLSRQEIRCEGEPPQGCQDDSKLDKRARLFVESLRRADKLKKLTSLPQEVSSNSCCQVASIHLPNDHTLLVAVTVEGHSGVFLTAVQLDGDDETVWTTLTCKHSPQTHITCLSLTDSPEGVLLSTSSSSAHVAVWTLTVTTGKTRFETRSLACCLHVSDPQITTCKWAPNGKFLSIGNLVGELFIYSVPDELASPCPVELTLIHKVSVCCGSITVLAWSHDSRMLAVGGSDDCIQILQCKAPAPPSPNKPHRESILNYFKREPGTHRQRYLHTHTLRGHQSFIADVQFISPNHVVSVGWDGQVLYWCPSPLMHSHHTADLHVDSDPQGGFKMGPSAILEFLPLSLHPLGGRGVIVVIGNRLGGVSVLHYSVNS